MSASCSGLIICGNCSKNRFLIEHVDARNPVRVCTECHDKLTNKGPGSGSGSVFQPSSPSPRRQSALLRFMIGDDEDGRNTPKTPGSEDGRETLMNFENYKEEIDSVKSMNTAPTPTSTSTQEQEQVQGLGQGLGRGQRRRRTS
jgi:hypothetical protein